MDERVLGRDLAVGFVADEEGRTFADPLSRADLQVYAREEVAPRTRDLETVEGRANLVQALLLRLKTQRGELEELGHPDYGSRHHRLVGRPNTESNRAILKLNLLECLAQEPRLKEIESLDVLPGQGPMNRDKVDVRARVRMSGEPQPIDLVIPFSFEEPVP